jgi:hypothetical protein
LGSEKVTDGILADEEDAVVPEASAPSVDGLAVFFCGFFGRNFPLCDGNGCLGGIFDLSHSVFFEEEKLNNTKEEWYRSISILHYLV